MKWIGLTGGIASGKSTAAQYLQELGFPVVDADQIAREVLAKGGSGLKAVVKQFGRELLDSNGELDRRALGRIVFAQPEKLRELEAIVHPFVREKMREEKTRFEQAQFPAAFYDVPLLFEKGLQDDFDFVVVVTSPEPLQTQRLKSRNSLGDQEIADRLSRQIPLAEKEKRADFVIQNTGTLADLKRQVLEMLSSLGLS